MERLLRLGGLGGLGGGGASQQQPQDGPMVDTAETIYISSMSLLKMLKHGRAGVPMEVMGLMLGEFVDDYTVKVSQIYSPQKMEFQGKLYAIVSDLWFAHVFFVSVF